MKKLCLAFLILFSSQTFALTMNETTFETQFEDQKLQLNKQIKWVFFSASKDGSEILRDAFKALEIDEKWLQKNKAIYVADIHGMPSLIAKFFALPKMRDYPYPIALDKEGSITKAWKNKAETVTVYKVENLEVMNQVTFESTEELIKFIKKGF